MMINEVNMKKFLFIVALLVQQIDVLVTGGLSLVIPYSRTSSLAPSHLEKKPLRL